MDLSGLVLGSVPGFHEHGRLMHRLVTYKGGRRGRGTFKGLKMSCRRGMHYNFDIFDTWIFFIHFKTQYKCEIRGIVFFFNIRCLAQNYLFLISVG